MAVGEAEEGRGAAFQDIGVRALRLPREGVEGGERGDIGSGTRKNAEEKSQRIRKRFSAAIGIRNEESRAAQFVREVGGDQRFGHIVQAGKRNMIGASAQFRKRTVQTGMTEHGFEAFADYRKYHA